MKAGFSRTDVDSKQLHIMHNLKIKVKKQTSKEEDVLFLNNCQQACHSLSTLAKQMPEKQKELHGKVTNIEKRLYQYFSFNLLEKEVSIKREYLETLKILLELNLKLQRELPASHESPFHDVSSAAFFLFPYNDKDFPLWAVQAHMAFNCIWNQYQLPPSNIPDEITKVIVNLFSFCIKKMRCEGPEKIKQFLSEDSGEKISTFSEFPPDLKKSIEKILLQAKKITAAVGASLTAALNPKSAAAPPITPAQQEKPHATCIMSASCCHV
jgi:hypothetical protein